MNTSFKYLLSVATLILILNSSCDEVKFPTGCEGEVDPVDTTDNDLNRRVLVIDFTGHRCAGCPAAAREANEIAGDFPGRIFALSVHPDIDGLTTPVPGAPGDEFATDWRTPEGDHYQDQYNLPPAIPLGAISAIDINGNYVAPSGSWRTEAEELIAELRPLTIELDITYDETSRALEVATSIETLMELDGEFNLVLATVENNIIDWQKNGSSEDSPADDNFPGGNIPNYVHKHVLRNHINGLQGEAVSSGLIDSGSTFELAASDVLDSDFVAEEVSIYAYVYDVNSLEMLDVVEYHIIE